MTRLPKGRETVIYLDQPHRLQDAGGTPLHGVVRSDPRQPYQAFLSPGRYPAFVGHGAWFRVIQHKRGVYTFLDRVAGPRGEPFIGPW